MDEGDPFADIKRSTAEGAMGLIEALDVDEVQEALSEWSNSLFRLIRALQRQELSRSYILGVIGATIFDTLDRMKDE